MKKYIFLVFGLLSFNSYACEVTHIEYTTTQTHIIIIGESENCEDGTMYKFNIKDAGGNLLYSDDVLIMNNEIDIVVSLPEVRNVSPLN